MTNPTPRPALRKADDADVHPAAPRPARVRRTPTTTPAPDAPVPVLSEREAAELAAAPRRRSGRKGRAFAGATSDHLRSPVEHPGPRRKAKDRSPEAGQGTAASTSPKGGKRPSPTASSGVPRAGGDDLMKGKVVDLGAQVPKRLRKAARAKAAARGLDLDAVTTELLHAWVTGEDRV